MTIQNALKQIKKVLETGEIWESETAHFPAGAIITAILSIKGMEKQINSPQDGFMTNGWQWDWWQEFIYKGKQYTLSGSGYSGGHSFYLSDGE